MIDFKTLYSKLNRYKKNKNFTDLLCNYASLIILGSTGLLLNIIVANYYDPETLGIFNQSISFYFIGSMICSFGINFSVLEAIPKANKNEIKAIIFGALLPLLLSSSFFIVIFFNSLPLITTLLDSKNLYNGLISIMPAIFFCSLNKVFLYGIYNGLRKMKEFAFFQALRYLLIIFSLCLFLNFSIKGYYLPAIFSISEIILFLLMFYRINNFTNFVQAKNWLKWSKKHVEFGFKAVFSGLITETNTKVDILMIGFFLSDKYVGIYSFASLFIEGYVLLIKVIKDNYNPVFSNYLKLPNRSKLKSFFRKVKYQTYFISSIISISLIVVYYPFMKIILVNDKYLDSFIPFLILLIGINLSSGYISFHEIFAMAKMPGLNTLFMLIFVMINVILNLIMIPNWGINGAAIATALSYLISSQVLSFMSKKFLKIKI